MQYIYVVNADHKTIYNIYVANADHKTVRIAFFFPASHKYLPWQFIYRSQIILSVEDIVNTCFTLKFFIIFDKTIFNAK